MIGKQISHYKILEKIGEGGMGVVYKARDLKLDRFVALKFLPHHIGTDEEEKQRFIHEAKAASALQHSNVSTIHEIDEADDGHLFICMDYYEGETLKDKIHRGPLIITEAIDIAIQVADGLKEAHEKNIVHRDIKSANIIVTSKGQTKIMDFGLAKLSGRTQLTKTGSTLGTAAYMSPEQTRGEEVNHRSDIWSLGVVLYEMITGQLPFKGEYEQAVVYSIVNEVPEPITGCRSGIPMEIERIVNKCLEKKQSERYQHADELIVDLTKLKNNLIGEMTKTTVGYQTKSSGKRLRRLGFAAVGILAALGIYLISSQFLDIGKKESLAERKMLVVLPFDNLGLPSDEYFADGITEEITSRLAEISELGVIARTSAIQYKNTDKAIQQIGEELGADFILEGTVRWEKQPGGESRVRVTPQLIRISDNIHLWTERYDAIISGIFQIQTDIAEQVAQALDITLLEPERRALRVKPTDNLEAYEYYIRGNDYYHRSDTEAMDMYERAIGLDPEFAQPYAKLSILHSLIYWNRWDQSEDRLVKAKDAVDKAFELRPELSEAHVALGYYYYMGHLDYDHALEQFSLARKSQPNNVDVLEGIGFIQRRQGKLEQTVINLKQAFKLDPRRAYLPSSIGDTYAFMRDYTEVESYYDRAIRLSPEWPEPYANRARMVLKWQGDTEKARAILQEGSRFFSLTDDPYVAYAWFLVDLFDRDYQSALAHLSESSLRAFEFHEYVVPKAQLISQIHGLMNRTELKQAYYDSARIELEALVHDWPDDARYHSALGIAYAGLGLKQDAIREGQLAVGLLPISKDAHRGPYLVEHLARIYVMVAENDSAIDQLEFLLSRPGTLSIPLLQLDPVWAPLKDHPRFKKLLEEGK